VVSFCFSRFWGYEKFEDIKGVIRIRNIENKGNNKLPNSEQSYKGKVKTHKYINRQNQSTTQMSKDKGQTMICKTQHRKQHEIS
jgi:hypothetical protein